MTSLLTDSNSYGMMLGDLFDKTVNVEDRTDEMMDAIFKPVKGGMSLFIVSILAMMGAGKTELCKYLMYKAEEYYKDDLKIIFTNDLAVAYEEFSDKKVHMIVVDDAVMYQSSFKSVEKSDMYSKFLEIRHMAERRCGNKGRVIILLNWQRMNLVNNTFRNETRLWLFMSPMSNKDDINQEIDWMGQEAFSAIKENWDLIQSGDESKKSRCIARLPQRDYKTGVGWFHSQYMPEYDPSWIPPKFLDSKEYFKPKEPEKTPVEKAMAMLEKNPKLERDVRIYRENLSGFSQVQLSKKYQLSKGSISGIISSIKNMVESMVMEESSKKVQ